MTLSVERSISDLTQLVDELDAAARRRFERLFTVTASEGRIVPPPTMQPWIMSQFGRLEDTLTQRVVRVTNMVTLEGALFNWLRSSRPIWRACVDVEAELAADGTADPFDAPYEHTPADTFGRITGRHCVTSSNVAKFDGYHGVVIFRERHPLRFTRDQVHDYLDTARHWADAAHREDATARYYLFIWNCLWRASASLLHGHAQMMLGREMHYPAVERLRRAALIYDTTHRADYFDDLYTAHADVGCAFQRADGVRVLASLTPVKEKEVLLIADAVTSGVKDALYDTLQTFRDQLGVTAFNVAIYQPPIGESKTGELWDRFPVMVRIVDRGDPSSRTADIGAMELYAASVISSDPFRVADALRAAMT